MERERERERERFIYMYMCVYIYIYVCVCARAQSSDLCWEGVLRGSSFEKVFWAEEVKMSQRSPERKHVEHVKLVLVVSDIRVCPTSLG